jgi:hypothetical protein
MAKLLVYLMGAAVSVGLVMAFGLTVLALCAVLALATLVFSNEPAEGAESGDASRESRPAGPLEPAPAI